jgi:UDP-3-O-[3-hydroxymyristoyl] glucosamine N-acyltransferase
MSPSVSLDDIAQRFGLERRGGEPGTAVTGAATLAAAGPGDLAFLANPQYRSQLPTTRAAAVVIAEADAADCRVAALVSRNPYADFARIATLFERREAPAPGVHPSAVVASGVVVEPGASVGPLCVIGVRCRIEAGAEVGPGCIIGDDCIVGPQSRLVARVTLVTRVRLGKRVLVHPGAVIGGDGFGIAMDKGHWVKVPQLGGAVIGDDCEIGANTCIDRGALGDTVLEEDVRLDNNIQVGHNVHIGAHTAMAGGVLVAGSAKIGRHVLVSGGSAIAGHIEICDQVRLLAMAMVTHSIREPGEYASGLPMQEARLWRRNAVRFRHLDDLARDVALLKRKQEDD